MLKRILTHLWYLKFLTGLKIQPKLKAQLARPLSIPVIIITSTAIVVAVRARSHRTWGPE